MIKAIPSKAHGAKLSVSNNEPEVSDQRAQDLLAKAVADLESILVDLESEV